MGGSESKLGCSCNTISATVQLCNCAANRVPWGRYQSGGNWNRWSTNRATSKQVCSSGTTRRAGPSWRTASGSNKQVLGRPDTGSGSNSGSMRSNLGHGSMRSKLGPTSGSNKHWRMSSATGSSSSCSEPSKTSRRVVEVITLSSSESEAEDLEIIAARLKKAKGTRKYTETTRRIVQSNRSKNPDDDSSKQECMCSRPRIPFTKLGSIRAMQKH